MPGEERSTGTPDEPAGHRPTAEVLRVLFERAPEIITLTDDESHQLLLNPAARKMPGIAPPTAVRYDGWSHVHPDDVPAVLALRQYLTSRPFPAEPPPPVRCRVRDASGAWRWLEMVVADLRDVPEVGGRVTFSRDVTEPGSRRRACGSRGRGWTRSWPACARVRWSRPPRGTVILANELLLAGFVSSASEGPAPAMPSAGSPSDAGVPGPACPHPPGVISGGGAVGFTGGDVHSGDTM